MDEATRRWHERCLAHARELVELHEMALGETLPPVGDLVPLRVAAVEFRKSVDTVRRWAVDEGLGEKIDGQWYLNRSLALRHKPHFA